MRLLNASSECIFCRLSTPTRALIQRCSPVTAEAAAQVTAVHRHHHDLMKELSLKQRKLLTGQSYVDAAPKHVNSRGDMHESVSQVHSIVMEVSCTFVFPFCIPL